MYPISLLKQNDTCSDEPKLVFVFFCTVFFERFDMDKLKDIGYKTLLLLLTLGFAGCNDSENNSRREFCSYLKDGDYSRITSAIDEILNGLSHDPGGEQKLQEVIAWLKSCPCVTDAKVLCQSCINTAETPVSEIAVSFDEKGDTKDVYLDILMANPMQAVEYREIPAGEALCSLIIDGENIDRIIPYIDKFLGSLSDDMDDSRKLQELSAWLVSIPCIAYAPVLCESCIPSGRPQSQVRLYYVSVNYAVSYYLYISMSNPLKVTGYGMDDRKPLCMCENMEQAIPVMNDFLSGLPEHLDDTQKFQELSNWFKAHACAGSSSIVLCQSCILTTTPPMAEFEVPIFGGRYILDISMTNPLKVVGYHETRPFHPTYLYYANSPLVEELKLARTNIVSKDSLPEWFIDEINSYASVQHPPSASMVRIFKGKWITGTIYFLCAKYFSVTPFFDENGDRIYVADYDGYHISNSNWNWEYIYEYGEASDEFSRYFVPCGKGKTPEETANVLCKKLTSAPVTLVSKESLPGWLVDRINNDEPHISKFPEYRKIGVFKGEWNNRTVYYIYQNDDYYTHKCFYEDGEKIVMWFDTYYNLGENSKNWELIYEFGNADLFVYPW